MEMMNDSIKLRKEAWEMNENLIEHEDESIWTQQGVECTLDNE